MLREYLKDEQNVRKVFLGGLALAALLTLLRPWLPDGLVRMPEAWLLPWRDWIDAVFQLIVFDLGLINVTRWLTGGLEFVLDAVSNILYGKRRWPRIEEIPWPVLAGVMTVIGYALGRWKLALLAGGTFVWAAMIGQWKMTMETMSVIVVAAPISFSIGMLIGKAVGTRFGKTAEIIGGVALIGLGTAILLEHLGVLGG